MYHVWHSSTKWIRWVQTFLCQYRRLLIVWVKMQFLFRFRLVRKTISSDWLICLRWKHTTIKMTRARISKSLRFRMIWKILLKNGMKTLLRKSVTWMMIWWCSILKVKSHPLKNWRKLFVKEQSLVRLFRYTVVLLTRTKVYRRC